MVWVPAIRGKQHGPGFGGFFGKQPDTAYRFLLLPDFLCNAVWLGVWELFRRSKYREWDKAAPVDPPLCDLCASGIAAVFDCKRADRELTGWQLQGRRDAAGLHSIVQEIKYPAASWQDIKLTAQQSRGVSAPGDSRQINTPLQKFPPMTFFALEWLNVSATKIPMPVPIHGLIPALG